jgi:hypothetical protein
MKNLLIALIVPILMAFSAPALAKSCSSDYSCSYGQSCVKEIYSSSGVCMNNVNKYGTKTFSPPKSSSFGYKSESDAQCRFDTDCPIGFDCDRRTRACVRD